MSKRAPRHASRQLALQVLYAMDVAAKSSGSRPGADEVFEDVAAHFDLPEGARAFAKELVCGVTTRAEEIDGLIATSARNWRVERMAAVDRNVLRLATWELLDTDTPVSVVLDEAIELARRFGDEPSPGFVNGVLDSVARDLARPAPATAEPRREEPR